MVDLINDMMRQRKDFLPHGQQEFARALRQTNVPQDLVGNRELWNWMHREGATTDAFSSVQEGHSDSSNERAPKPDTRSKKKRQQKIDAEHEERAKQIWENFF